MTRNDPTHNRQRRPVIRASEIGEYVYCARAWWLHRVAGREPAGAERRAAGVRLHTRHSTLLRRSTLLLIAAALLAAGGGVLLLFTHFLTH